MHFIVQDRELAQQRAPEIKRPNVAFAVTAGILLDRFDLALVAYGFPDQGLYPVQAVENDGIKLVFLSLQCPDLGQEIGNRFGLRESGDIELFGALLGADKDGFGAWEKAVVFPTPSTPYSRAKMCRGRLPREMVERMLDVVRLLTMVVGSDAILTCV
jgi:hypothetical protein